MLLEYRHMINWGVRQFSEILTNPIMGISGEEVKGRRNPVLKISKKYAGYTANLVWFKKV